MDAERLQDHVSDTEDDGPQPVILTNPLLEVCMRLKCCFAAVQTLRISSIEDASDVDYDFIHLRVIQLAEFGHVELERLSATPPTYRLCAHRSSPPRIVDLDAAQAENVARIPANANMHHPGAAPTTFSVREALYLMEHRSVYKVGDEFRMAHAPYRIIEAHSVRVRYTWVVEALRQRFPERFPTLPP